VTKELIDPDEYVFDFMSYCSPVWVSDYTYTGLYNRMLEVQQTKRPDVQKSVKSYHVGPDGKLRPGPTFKGGFASTNANDTFVLENSAHGEREIGARIAVGDRVDVEVVDDAALRLDGREGRVDDRDGGDPDAQSCRSSTRTLISPSGTPPTSPTW